MSEPSNNFTNPERQANEPANPSDTASRQSPIAPQIQPSDTEKTSTCKRKETTKWNHSIEISAFVVLCIYTAFAGWQSYTISNQLEADQRAWVGLQSSDVTREENGKIGVHLTIANTGRTPARDMKWESYDELVKPRGYVTPEYTAMEDGDLWYPATFPANLAKPDVTFFGNKRHGTEELTRWRNKELWDELAVRVTYIDSFGKHRQTGVCIYVIGSGSASAHCPTNNYEK